MHPQCGHHCARTLVFRYREYNAGVSFHTMACIFIAHRYHRELIWIDCRTVDVSRYPVFSTAAHTSLLVLSACERALISQSTVVRMLTSYVEAVDSSLSCPDVSTRWSRSGSDGNRSIQVIRQTTMETYALIACSSTRTHILFCVQSADRSRSSTFLGG